ncbi:lysophospholipase [Flavobacterium faecale]|uniref:Lysophospholipase n=1 Tax=Flavobacterium faecale TaxID=1355330 RepID=A0A2S1LIB7_9FLAO|nr:SGNH/GDSL hydrolase family protein [Flavobacterium faecale]AWG23540.1 lysophospholipase [Flavobacterium faecale]
MQKTFTCIVTLLLSLALLSCSAEGKKIKNTPQQTSTSSGSQINYLALGDSYTIGQSVCTTCSFPEQLKERLATSSKYKNIKLDIIARTGWTSTNLNAAIQVAKPTPTYDIVTVLIGVNNQFQRVDFSVYEKEFASLVQQSIIFAKGNKNKVIVLSIPDYAYSPYGQSSSDPAKISFELDRYNAYAKTYCEKEGITFINITDITRQGLQNPKLISEDGLHPSSLAYSLFTDQLYPLVISKLDQN